MNADNLKVYEDSTGTINVLLFGEWVTCTFKLSESAMEQCRDSSERLSSLSGFSNECHTSPSKDHVTKWGMTTPRTTRYRFWELEPCRRLSWRYLRWLVVGSPIRLYFRLRFWFYRKRNTGGGG